MYGKCFSIFVQYTNSWTCIQIGYRKIWICIYRVIWKTETLSSAYYVGENIILLVWRRSRDGKLATTVVIKTSMQTSRVNAKKSYCTRAHMRATLFDGFCNKAYLLLHTTYNNKATGSSSFSFSYIFFSAVFPDQPSAEECANCRWASEQCAVNNLFKSGSYRSREKASCPPTCSGSPTAVLARSARRTNDSRWAHAAWEQVLKRRWSHPTIFKFLVKRPANARPKNSSILH